MSKAKSIAVTWFEDKYDEHQAKRSADVQDVNWIDVLNEYGAMYAEMEGYSCGS